MNRNKQEHYIQFLEATLAMHDPLQVLNLIVYYNGSVYVVLRISRKDPSGPHPLYPYLTGAPTHLSPLKGAPPTFVLN